MNKTNNKKLYKQKTFINNNMENKFKCPRCGKEYKSKAALKKHFERKKLCDPKLKDISRNMLMKYYECNYENNDGDDNVTIVYKTPEELLEEYNKIKDSYDDLLAQYREKSRDYLKLSNLYVDADETVTTLKKLNKTLNNELIEARLTLGVMQGKIIINKDGEVIINENGNGNITSTSDVEKLLDNIKNSLGESS